ncbi:hypothetical protein M426DRAFT_23590 [Hypoxylon sp. CI-4A]|nr:hypothetical protein M426DRAFT_23590 [Hypoxylon sp. CI-4A]
MGWLKAVSFLILTQACLIHGFSWRRGSKPTLGEREDQLEPTTRGSFSQRLTSQKYEPSSYEIALNEFRELESEPLCHRTAARLLVNSCELLEGKDDATSPTDSGRRIRDFVDSYAASLAICDLERGNFLIPKECDNFREPVLSQLSPKNSGKLHVTSAENTWVSYRHKALRFCEAARADNEKAEHILLFQRLTKIMGRFTDDIDKQFEQHMSDLDFRAQAAGGRIDELSPRVDHLKDSLKSVEDMFLGRLIHAVKETTDAVNFGTQNAANLQRMLEAVYNSALQNQVDLAYTYERSMELANQRVESTVDTAVKAIAVATESAGHLQNQIELSYLRTMELESRQDNLELGMMRLLNVTEHLTAKYDDHTNLLHQASNMTNEILDTLEGTAASASYVSDSIRTKSSALSWWPYIWCPAASLVLGSYGLPPSAVRNIALVALGEVAGWTYSSIQSFSGDFFSMPSSKLSSLVYTWEVPFTTSKPSYDIMNRNETRDI